MDNRKTYVVINYNCDDDTTEIELTYAEYQTIMRYYNIIDNMGASNEYSPPIDKKLWELWQNT